MNKKGNGNIPVLHAKGESIPEAWENSILELYNKGLWWCRDEKTKDKGEPNLDSTMTIEITNPDSNLIMHQYHLYTFEGIFEYQMEMLGAKNSWVILDKETTDWPYHYSERFLEYPRTEGFINQIEKIIKGLSDNPSKRRNQIITWVPERDLDSKDPPCLQRVWFNIVPDESSKDNTYKLNTNYHFRSRNVMNAAPVNMVGLWTLQSYIRDKIIENTGMSLQNGRLVDMVDSYHVSAQDKSQLVDFIGTLAKHSDLQSGERCYDKQTVFGSINKTLIENNIIEQTKKQLAKKGQEYKLDNEIEKIRQISQIVSEINKY